MGSYEAVHGNAAAGSAQALRAVAGVRRSAQSLATRWHIERILANAQTRAVALGEVVWEVSIDSFTARAHHHASGVHRRRSRADEKRRDLPPELPGTRTQPWRANDQVSSRL